MPELPDIVVYVESLETRLLGRTLQQIRLLNPFLLRTATPPIAAAEGKKAVGVRRLGKRIVIVLEGDLFLVLHLMIAGRLRWFDGKAKLPGRISLAVFEFDNGKLVLTEAGTKRRASLHLVEGEGSAVALHAGGLEVLESDLKTFSGRLKAENHTLKRALTDLHIFSGIGNAYSDEILHRASLSPIPRKSPPSAKAWQSMGVMGSPARSAVHRCSASSMPRTRPTIARAAKPAARSSPIAHCRACSRKAGRARSTKSVDHAPLPAGVQRTKIRT